MLTKEKGQRMKSLIVDDDFYSRRLLQTILNSYGESHVAIDGEEALMVFKQALIDGCRYDLVCLDIMMPEMDGQEVLKRIREIESEQGLYCNDCTKVIMTTALDDTENIKEAFRSQCESYLIKPIVKEKLLKTLNDLTLL